MPKKHHPRKGSLQFWPRKRSRKSSPRIRSWININELKPLGFIGYKVGMTHLLIIDTNQNSPSKGQEIFTPVTVIECPPIKPFSLRFYKKTSDGLKLLTEIFSKNLDKELKRKITSFKKQKETKIPEVYDELRLVVYTQPKLTHIGKKKPEIVELSIGGNDQKEKLNYLTQILDKDIKLSDVFREGQLLDIHSITKGKGFQGPIKRFGLKLKQHKSEKKKRSGGNLGAWTPAKVSWTVPQAGKMGYHLRTEYNKLAMKISSNPKEINQKGGFLHYGLIKNDYLIIKGSIPGPTKRTIILTEPIRKMKEPKPVEIAYTSLSSKQGN